LVRKTNTSCLYRCIKHNPGHRSLFLVLLLLMNFLFYLPFYAPLPSKKHELWPLSQRVFIRSLSNLVNILQGIISRPSSITSQIPPGTPELWPLNCPKTELVVSALQVEYPAPKNVVITIELPQIRRAYCVSVWHSCLIYNSACFWDKVT